MSITYPHRRNLSGSGGSGSATASASTPTSNLSGCAHASTDRADSADSHHPRAPSTAPQKSQAIPPGQFSTPPINVAIPTIPFPCLKGLHGNCMRNCRARTELRCRTQQPAAPEHPPHSNSQRLDTHMELPQHARMHETAPASSLLREGTRPGPGDGSRAQGAPVVQPTRRMCPEAVSDQPAATTIREIRPSR